MAFYSLTKGCYSEMAATLDSRADNIGLIRKKHVDIDTPPAAPAYVMPRRTTGNERNTFLLGKRLQREILEAFDEYGTFQDRQRMGGMVLCMREQEWHECPDNHEGRLHRAEFCGNRLCPICVKRRAILAKRKYRPVLTTALTGEYTDGQQQMALFVTVNWPSVEHITDEHISGMWKDLGRLKRQKWWSDRVTGETWSFEWTFSPVFGHHSHAHGIVLVDRHIYEACQKAFKAAHGPAGMDQINRKDEAAVKAYKAWAALWWADNGPIPKPMLKNAWEGLTGAHIVNVKLIRPRTKEWGNQSAMDAALDECLKYPCKETDYLEDRPLTEHEWRWLMTEEGKAWLAGRPEGLLDRREALVELWRAIRGRRLTDTRGCVRGKLREAMREVEEAKTEELLRMDLDEMTAYASQCSHCGKPYVEREYAFQRRGDHLAYWVTGEAPYGTTKPDYDNQARRLLHEEFDRQTLRHVANAVVRPWLKKVRERGSYGKKRA